MRTGFNSAKNELPGAGGFFGVSGGTSAAIAAALAANTVLMAMRFAAAPNPTVVALIHRLRLRTFGVTQATSGLQPGLISWQRFNTASPTGGTVRTPGAFNQDRPNATQVSTVQDNPAGLTTTGMVFGDIMDTVPVPLFTGGMMEEDFLFEPPHPIVLKAGEGLCLRTQTAMPATQTWGFAYLVTYDEE